jgi:hypothetical protein
MSSTEPHIGVAGAKQSVWWFITLSQSRKVVPTQSTMRHHGAPKYHADFGDNPHKRKEIREMRDW